MDVKELEKHFSIIPIGKYKAPAIPSWKPYQTKKIDSELLAGHDRFGIICGFENLEVIDIDNHFGDADDLLSFIYNNTKINNLPIVRTINGGYHIYLKCSVIEGNKKLAQRINDKKRPETLIETRGAGGYVVAPPTKGYDLITGDLLNVPFITPEQRDDLLSICNKIS